MINGFLGSRDHQYRSQNRAYAWRPSGGKRYAYDEAPEVACRLVMYAHPFFAQKQGDRHDTGNMYAEDYDKHPADLSDYRHMGLQKIADKGRGGPQQYEYKRKTTYEEQRMKDRLLPDLV